MSELLAAVYLVHIIARVVAWVMFVVGMNRWIDGDHGGWRLAVVALAFLAASGHVEAP
jgi:hypothetical protein